MSDLRPSCTPALLKAGVRDVGGAVPQRVVDPVFIPHIVLEIAQARAQYSPWSWRAYSLTPRAALLSLFTPIARRPSGIQVARRLESKRPALRMRTKIVMPKSTDARSWTGRGYAFGSVDGLTTAHATWPSSDHAVENETGASRTLHASPTWRRPPVRPSATGCYISPRGQYALWSGFWGPRGDFSNQQHTKRNRTMSEPIDPAVGSGTFFTHPEVLKILKETIPPRLGRNST